MPLIIKDEYPEKLFREDGKNIYESLFSKKEKDSMEEN